MRFFDEALSLWERAERGVFCRALVRESTRCLESFPHLAGDSLSTFFIVHIGFS